MVGNPKMATAISMQTSPHSSVATAVAAGVAVTVAVTVAVAVAASVLTCARTWRLHASRATSGAVEIGLSAVVQFTTQ